MAASRESFPECALPVLGKNQPYNSEAAEGYSHCCDPVWAQTCKGVVAMTLGTAYGFLVNDARLLFAWMGGKHSNRSSAKRRGAGKYPGNSSLQPEAERPARFSTNLRAFLDESSGPHPDGPKAYVATSRGNARRLGLAAKRLMDVTGSIFAMAFFAPVLSGLALLVKITSAGPVLSRQERIGLKGERFMLLRFRTMRVDNDAPSCGEVAKGLASGADGGREAAKSGRIHRIRKDSRVTALGRLLRKTSLDELPQFLNVLRGDMSLVGPRPPITREYDGYDLRHRHRELDMKPGLTGLWQVTGRSPTSFEEMVRLDIHYIRQWSLWLDIKIMLKTPLAIL